MIIIERKNIENSVYFPRNLYKNEENEYKLVLNNRATNKTYTFENLEDKKLWSIDYYVFFINFKDVPEDEYEYKIFTNKDVELASGIIKLKDDEKTTVYYNKNREYIAYDKQ